MTGKSSFDQTRSIMILLGGDYAIFNHWKFCDLRLQGETNQVINSDSWSIYWKGLYDLFWG